MKNKTKNKYNNKTKKNKNNKTKKLYKKEREREREREKEKEKEKEKNLVITYVGFESEFEKGLSDKDLIKTNEDVKKEFVKQLLTPFSSDAIKPNNNFYNYINYMWLKNSKLDKTQSYLTQVDSYNLTQDKVNGNLNEIIQNYIKNNNNALSKKIINLFKYNQNCTVKNIPKVIKYSLEFSNEFVTKLDDLRKNKNNLWKLLAFLNSSNTINFMSPFYFIMKPDKKNSKVFRFYFEKYTFQIKDKNVYINDGSQIEYKENYRNKYYIYLKKLFDFFLGKNSKINCTNVFKVEQKLLEAMNCDDLKEDEFNYNRIYTKDALEIYKFNWKEYCQEFGFKKTPEFFIMSSKNYLKCCTELLINEWNSEEWRPFWLLCILQYINRAGSCKEATDNYYNFYTKFQQGSIKRHSISKTFTIATLTAMYNPKFINDEYVKKYYNEQQYQYLKTMTEELRIVFIRIIKRNSWLSNKTKNYAVKKIENLKFQFLEPNNFMDDNVFNYTDYAGKNTYINGKILTQKLINLEGKGIVNYVINTYKYNPGKLDGNASFVVNAYYQVQSNSIFIPLAIMQKPFLDINERGIEYNLANIGFIIAHEFSHALDNIGHLYDLEGNLNDWWEESDKKKYMEIQKDIIAQYEEFAKRDDILYDSSISVGENIADISGLAICEEYLRDYQQHNELLTPNRAYSFRQFYTYFCIQMRQKIPKAAYKNQLNNNPHPPDIYRTNVPLSRSEVFRATFNIKEGDGMWWHNTNTIW